MQLIFQLFISETVLCVCLSLCESLNAERIFCSQMYERVTLCFWAFPPPHMTAERMSNREWVKESFCYSDLTCPGAPYALKSWWCQNFRAITFTHLLSDNTCIQCESYFVGGMKYAWTTRLGIATSGPLLWITVLQVWVTMTSVSYSVSNGITKVSYLHVMVYQVNFKRSTIK